MFKKKLAKWQKYLYQKLGLAERGEGAGARTTHPPS